MPDSPAKSRKDPQKSKKTRLPPDSCLNNPVPAQTHAGPEQSVCSPCHHRTSLGSKSFRQVRCQSVFTKFLAAHCHCIAPCPCFACCCTINVDNCLFLCCTSGTGSTSLIFPHIVVECGILGQWNTNPANLQCSCSTEPETGFVPTSAQFFVVGTFLILMSPT